MLYNIPFEVIAFKIFPRVGIESIVNLTKISKEFHKNKQNLYSYVQFNDYFLNQYVKFHKFNLIRMITESSISYKHFDEIYDNIKYNLRNKRETFQISNNTEQYKINNTFMLLQMFKCSIDYKMCRCAVSRKKETSRYVTNLMKSYFTSMYFERNNGMHFYTSFLQDIEINWERSNINLYNICENLNLMCADKDSITLKHNMQTFDDTIINNNGLNIISTPLIIKKLFKDSNVMKVEIFINYIVFRYLNFVFHMKLHKNIMTNKNFINSSLNTLRDYEYGFKQYYNHLVAPYFKENILNEISCYKHNIEIDEQNV